MKGVVNTALGEAARLMAYDSDTVEAGRFYTVSKAFDTGDATGCDRFWEVLTVNGPNAFVRIHLSSTDKVELFTEIADRSWHRADDAWAMCKVVKGE